ncbi:putative spermidine/putrescine transport system permease protein [Loktanella ponticola]|uniref:Putative spermidine/putrescine transport system permease protein n=1 Tax=Yoonia ponticola TaxID=1524255 RepID=A0A7W9BMM9_9RHOB|nr:ABC transporter permease [Yoonia ponticola]MBB5723343.1 putative spermidine/putrescine transport system permease protein [Yoonia ponticola]
MAEQVLAADGRPLKTSLNRALRRQKLRALMLIAPLLLFILLSFVMPIADMLFRSVENQIVGETLPRTVVELKDWDATSGAEPDAAVFEALARDLSIAVEEKSHTRLGSRLNYELTGISSLFRKTGRSVDEVGEAAQDALEALSPAWAERSAFGGLLGTARWTADLDAWDGEGTAPAFEARPEMAAALPETTRLYTSFANMVGAEGDNPLTEKQWPIVSHVFAQEIVTAETPDGLDAFGQAVFSDVKAAMAATTLDDPKAIFIDVDEDWGSTDVWRTIQTYSPAYTDGYFLNSIDRLKGADGSEARPENEQVYVTLFIRTMIMSFTITVSCIVLGYPIAWLLANLPARKANLLMILVLLPFWTSLLVRTSAWKVLLQQQGVINDILVWIGLVADDNRLQLINNQTGTIIAMTHILLPFMILPLYSVMKTIPPTYLRAAKSLGATNWTAFWRVYFPQSIPGIGAGSILAFILSIGYYITPEIVGGTKGVFISNRIAYHISTSLNWGLAAALGAILLAIVMLFYYAYDKIVGIDNVKLGG